PRELEGATVDLTIQPPDRILIKAKVGGKEYSIGRKGQSMWVYVPDQHFGVIGLPDVPRFSTDPQSLDRAPMTDLDFPANEMLLKASLMALSVRGIGDERVGKDDCAVASLAPPAGISDLLRLPPSTIEVAVRKTDSMPMRLRYFGGKARIELIVEDPTLQAPVADDTWDLHPAAGDTIEKVALSHLRKFMAVAPDVLMARVPTLGPATGQKRVVAVDGKGRLEMHDGTRVLFLCGTPEEMGHQQGTLLRSDVRNLVNKILYGVGVGSSFAKGRWFFGEIEQAHKHLAPFISERSYRELDALAQAAGVSKEEARLSNFFPELFHCSGFALTGSATVDGRIFHGRVLDYLRGVGLEQSAIVAVYRPDEGYAWVNVGYAGFIGSVTAMNEKHISIGEMGGHGQGNWDGKPMAQLVREVMEKAATLDEAVKIMRDSPRTCEYYYVIADGKSKKAVGIKATPTIFETVGLGDPHPQLSHPVKDTVLLSAGSRYEELSRRVEAGFGKFDADSARALMDPPVCMNSNIHSVLFAPDTLDFWIANADSKNVASKARYTHYNLRQLLESKAGGIDNEK
ncbi:MAG: C45 family autoproteolytic acyltransferase/hydrolase, partial [Tepidisphaerales bacterium]